MGYNPRMSRTVPLPLMVAGIVLIVLVTIIGIAIRAGAYSRSWAPEPARRSSPAIPSPIRMVTPFSR